MLAIGLLLAPALMAQPWHQLTMDDFQGVPPGSSSAYIAYTNCWIHYDYDVRKSNGQYTINFYVKMAMNPTKSWMNKSEVVSSGLLQEVLRHEQGHYNMAYLEQQELQQALNQTSYGADYQRQITDIFEAIDQKYRNLNQAYEQESQHMLNRPLQQKWNVWFREQISTIGNYAYQRGGRYR